VPGPAVPPHRRSSRASRCTRPDQADRPGRITSAPPTSKPPPGHPPREMALDTAPANSRARQVLLRKEVIQPHLPVRLPCYDFVPIAGPTFDGSSPDGLGHRLRVLPTFVT
jgi:hypothetical protein